MSVLAHALSSRYYLGFVNYNGTEYQGRHQPLVDPATFAAAQLVQVSHRHGERRQAHQHPLKGRLRCARCGNHLSFSVAKDRYRYFFCLTRHGSHRCDLPYLPADGVEAAVLNHYRRLALSPGQRSHLVTALKRELAIAGHHLEEQQAAQVSRRERLDREQARLLQAYYQQIVTEALFKTEQARIERESKEISGAEQGLDVGRGQSKDVEARALNLARSLDLAEAYRSAPDQVQRYLTRACFARLDVDDLGTHQVDGHGRHHDIQITEARLPRTLDYRQLVYALLLLAGRISTPADTNPDVTASLDAPNSDPIDRKALPAA